jgi:hypothetical protein
VQQHVKILAWLTIIYGAIGIVVGLIVFLLLGGLAGFIHLSGHSGDAQAASVILPIIGVVVVVVLVIVSAPSILAGWGLLSFKPWARILTLVLSALHILNVPVGTALGAYGFWVLLSNETEPLFRDQGYPTPQQQYRS